MRVTQDDLADAITTVRRLVPETPAYAWPLLKRRTGLDIVVKHENHTPTGSFKARGGLVFVERLRQRGLPPGLVTATRGNHGQSVAIGARAAGIPALIVVPEGNSREKNAAMESFGGEVMIAGANFDESRRIAAAEGEKRGLLMVPSFHPDLVIGVATYGAELFEQWADLDAVFVPIGMGSGICALIALRDYLGLKTDIIGVVAENAPAFAQSFAAGRPIIGERSDTFADGMACREPMADSFDIVKHGAKDIVAVSEDEIAEAVRIFYADTHNLAEGAGAAALAGLLKQRDHYRGKTVAVIQTGGNIDRDWLVEVLKGGTPKA